MTTGVRLLWVSFVLYVAIIPTGCRRVSQTSSSNSTPNAEAQFDGKLVDARLILEQGRSQGQMPNGLSIRIGACMGEADDGHTRSFTNTRRTLGVHAR